MRFERGVSFTKELSIFIDESGDFGPLEPHSPYYLFTLVLHDQSEALAPHISRLEAALVNSGLKNSHCFHIGPLVRKESDYEYFDIRERRQLLNKLVAFVRNVDIRYKTCIVEKKQTPDAVALTMVLSRLLSRFLMDNLQFFQEVERVVVYYDNGQVELTRLLASVFSVIFPHVEFRRVFPAQYRLFQVADLLCTMELIAIKAEHHALSKSELAFFGNVHDFKKNYLTPLRRKRME